ncbi:penicillin acylase family protein [Methylobacterium oryzae CBMB20]
MAPSRTATGRAILASDPHRVYLQPSLRYAVHLTAPGLDVIGAGEPALPGISIGHNGRAAFSLTIAPIDQEDLFVCATDPADPDRYRSGDGWAPIARVAERIPVRGGPDETVILGFTRHGPVLREDGAAPSRCGPCGRSPALLPISAASPISVPRRSRPSARPYTTGSAPSVNQLYADTAGHIAWFMAGKAPVRPGHDGLLPVPGDGRYDWAGFHDPAALPRSVDPEAGWLATANEMNLPPDYPAEDRRVGFEWAEPWRARRIRAVLGGQDRHSLADSRALQGDVVSEPARRLADLVRALPAAGDPDAAAAQALLAAFDGALHHGSAAAALIEVVWVRHLRPALVAALVPDAGTRRHLPPGDTQSLIERLETGLDPATRASLLTDALGAGLRTCRERMGTDAAGWSWGRLHRALFAHPLTALAPGSGWDVGPLPVGGAAASVMHAEYRTDTFRLTHGASFRMVVDVGDWDRSVFIQRAGPVGRPGKPALRRPGPGLGAPGLRADALRPRGRGRGDRDGHHADPEPRLTRRPGRIGTGP